MKENRTIRMAICLLFFITQFSRPLFATQRGYPTEDIAAIFIDAYIDSIPDHYGPITRFKEVKGGAILYHSYMSNRVQTELFAAMVKTFDTLKSKPSLAGFNGKPSYEIFSPRRSLEENRHERTGDLVLLFYDRFSHKGHSYIAAGISCYNDPSKSSGMIYLDIDQTGKVVNYYYKYRVGV